MSATDRRRRLNPAQRLIALLASLWLLVQVSGVQQLCLCGSCAVSQVLAQWLPAALAPQPSVAAVDEHPCCAEARREAERAERQRDQWRSAEDGCGCGESGHQWQQAWNSEVDALAGWQAPEFTALQTPLPPDLPRLGLQATADRALFARGPPTRPPTDLYLAQQRLLI